MSLYPCPNCKEKSCARKVYGPKDRRKVVEFCLNGCGYKIAWNVPLK